MTLVVQTELRDKATKGHLRQLREDGMIPGIIYGTGIDNVPIAVSEKQLHPVLRQHANTIIELNVPRLGTRTALIKETQQELFTGRCRHVDFQLVGMNAITPQQDDGTGESERDAKQAETEVAAAAESEP